jgi:hypothetical protein
MRSATTESEDPSLRPLEAGVPPSQGHSGHVVRIEPDHLVIILDGAVVLALDSIDAAPAVVGMAIFRIEPDCLVVVLDGKGVVALALVGEAPADVGERYFRIEQDRSVEVLDRPVLVPLAPLTRPRVV